MLDRVVPVCKEQLNRRYNYLGVDPSFTAILRSHCERDGKSHYEMIAVNAHLDPGLRLSSHQRREIQPFTEYRNPLGARSCTERVWQTDELLLAAGYAPLVVPGKGLPSEENPERSS